MFREHFAVHDSMESPESPFRLYGPLKDVSDDSAMESARRWGGVGMLAGNDVVALVDGVETYASMVKAIKTANGPSHFVYFANWRMDLNFPLIPGVESSKLKNLLSSLDKNVEIRSLLSFDFLGNHAKIPLLEAADWNITEEHLKLFGHHPSPRLKKKLLLKTLYTGSWPGSLLNLGINSLHSRLDPRIGNLTKEYSGSLSNGSFIPDMNHLFNGLHHQKILVVKGSEGLIGFCGGVDFAPNRVPQAGKKLAELHDVHCMIRGPAARWLLLTFIQRWKDHPDNVGLPKSKVDLRGENELKNLPARAGDLFVKIGRTFGNGSKHSGIESKDGKSFYNFTGPTGEKTAYELIVHAIRGARKYIYIEDQYLISIDAANELRKQILSNKELKVIILIPHSKITTDLQFPFKYRSDFILTLTGGKYPHPQISICYLKSNQVHNYVHAKTWVFDDEFAIIGSANCNNRGYTHDSEVVAGIYDPGRAGRSSRWPFAKNLRIRLWEEHLKISSSSLEDPMSSAKYWFSPPSSSSIEVVPYGDLVIGSKKEVVIDILQKSLGNIISSSLSSIDAFRMAKLLVDPRGD